MIQVVMCFLDETPSMDVKLSVIETLRTVTEGKVGLSLRLITCLFDLLIVWFAAFR